MHYAVPRILSANGQLEALFTEVVAPPLIQKLLAKSTVLGKLRPLARLAGRVPPGLCGAQIKTFPAFGLAYALRRQFARTATELTSVHLWAGTRFCEKVIHSGLGAARGLYVFNSAGLELLRHAKESAVFKVLEQTIAPRSVERLLVKAEIDKHPDWYKGEEADGSERAFINREQEEWDAADLILCGSDFVRGAISQAGGPAHKCTVVPYGVEVPEPAQFVSRRCGKLRALFVGSVGIRKGAVYLLQAAKALRGAVDFTIVGPLDCGSRLQQELKRYARLTGPIPRGRIHAYYQNADVFVLPSICEGSATVSYEALAHGLPVVTTLNAGTVVRDGIEGLIIPPGSTDALVDGMTMLASNRDRLLSMAIAARQRASEYTIAAYAQRLLATLNTPPALP